MEKNSQENNKKKSNEFEFNGSELNKRIQEIIKEGNIRKIIIRKESGEILLEIPLTAGVAVSGVMTLFIPQLAAIGAIAALISKVKVEIVRKDQEENEGPPEEKP